MSKRSIAEIALWLTFQLSKLWVKKPEKTPKSIFILRNNGLGDLLCVTPVFEMLRKKFPEAQIIVGIGSWHEDLLKNNPFINGTIQVNAPWHNQFNDVSGILPILKYIFFSKEIKTLDRFKFDLSFDIVGSFWGSILFLKLAIPQRIGVKGYDGGHSSNHLSIIYDSKKHVSQAALDMAKLLEIQEMPEARPQVFLSKSEISYAEKIWNQNTSSKRIILAPGGSFKEKCWGDKNFSQLTNLLLENKNYQICIIGSKEDENRILLNKSKQVSNLCGDLNLRQSAALVSIADFVICNSSLTMHLAGAFKIPALILLGEWYESSILHQKQWGYPESTIVGKEGNHANQKIPSVDDAYNLFKKLTNSFISI